MKQSRVTILGSTGSIGLNTIDVVQRHLDLRLQVFKRGIQADAVDFRQASSGGAAGPRGARRWSPVSANQRSLAARVVAVAVTAQGDGSWLVGANNQPVGDAWIWLDARAAPTITVRLRHDRVHDDEQ